MSRTQASTARTRASPAVQPTRMHPIPSSAAPGVKALLQRIHQRSCDDLSLNAGVAVIPASLSADCRGVPPTPILEASGWSCRVPRVYMFGSRKHRLTSRAISNVNLFGSPSLASEAVGQQPPHSLHRWFPLSAGSKNWGIPNVKTH